MSFANENTSFLGHQGAQQVARASDEPKCRRSGRREDQAYGSAFESQLARAPTAVGRREVSLIRYDSRQSTRDNGDCRIRVDAAASVGRELHHECLTDANGRRHVNEECIGAGAKPDVRDAQGALSFLERLLRDRKLGGRDSDVGGRGAAAEEQACEQQGAAMSHGGAGLWIEVSRDCGLPC